MKIVFNTILPLITLLASDTIISQQCNALPGSLRRLVRQGMQRQLPQTFATGFFSDEDSAVSCNQFGAFALVTGIYCNGGRCDNVQLECTIPSQSDIGDSQVDHIYWTEIFSDEDDDRFITCDEHYFVTGMNCQEGRCDNISLQCTKFARIGSDANDCEVVTGFSEEDEFVSRLDQRKYLVGMRCYDGRCDNKDLQFCGSRIGNIPSINQGFTTREFFETQWFSEEDGPVSCSDTKQLAIVTGMDCDGSHCDNIKLHCTVPERHVAEIQSVEDRYWTPTFSDEDGLLAYVGGEATRFAQTQNCATDYFVTGMECVDGDYCDNIRLECTKFDNILIYYSDYNCAVDNSGFSEEDESIIFAIKHGFNFYLGYLVGMGCQAYDDSPGGDYEGRYCDNKDFRYCRINAEYD